MSASCAAVALAPYGLSRDLLRADLALGLVEFLWRRVDLDAQAARGLVDQVDGLVGEEAVGDVAVREFGRGDDRAVRDAHAVVDLVAVLDAAQDRDGVGDRRLVHQDHLKAALQRLVLLEVLPVLVQRRGSNRAEFASGESRLEDIGRVHRAVAAACADERVDLVDEENDLALGLRHLLDDGLEPVLELAAVLGARDERAHVERHDGLGLQPLGHIALHDADREPFGDGRLAHAGLADEHRVVLGPAREDLEHAPDLVVAPDHRIDLALAGRLVQVARVAVERVVLALGVGVGHALPAADALQRFQHPRLGHVLRAQRLARGALAFRERDQQVLDGDVLVA